MGYHVETQTSGKRRHTNTKKTKTGKTSLLQLIYKHWWHLIFNIVIFHHDYFPQSPSTTKKFLSILENTDTSHRDIVRSMITVIITTQPLLPLKRLVNYKPFRKQMRFSSHYHISGYHLQRVVMSIGSKPADKLVPNHCHSPRMQDSSWEHQGMIDRIIVSFFATPFWIFLYVI